MRPKHLMLLALVAFGGCTTGETISSLQPGMSKAEVVSVMGEPDGYATESGAEVLSYTNRLMSGWGWDRADYHVVLRDGAVTQYGAGTVREKPGPNASTLLLVPVR